MARQSIRHSNVQLWYSSHGRGASKRDSINKQKYDKRFVICIEKQQQLGKNEKKKKKKRLFLFKKKNHVKRNSDESASSSETVIEHAYTLIFSTQDETGQIHSTLNHVGGIQMDQLIYMPDPNMKNSTLFS